MTCVDNYEINPHTMISYREEKIIHINGRLVNGLMYLYSTFQFIVVIAFTTYTNSESELI
jgi:hypothetical protein